MTTLGDLDLLEVELDAIRAQPIITLELSPERIAQALFVVLDQYCIPVKVQAAKSPEAYSNTDSLATKYTLMKFAGGSVAAAKYTLPLLEKLPTVEETLIRHVVNSSLLDMCRAMKLEGVRGNGGAMATLTRLAMADWFILLTQVSILTPWLYAVLIFDEERKPKIHRRMCMDDVPLVKQSAFQNLVLLFDCMQRHMENQTLELMENMWQCLVDFALKNAEKWVEEKQQDIVHPHRQGSHLTMATILPSLPDLAPQHFEVDASKADEVDARHVRRQSSQNEAESLDFSELCSPLVYVDTLVPAKVVATVEPLYTKLLRDTEPQERKAAILILEELLSIKGGAGGGKILFIVQNMAAEVTQMKLLLILKNLCYKLFVVSILGTGMELFDALSMLYALVFVYLTTCASLIF